MPLAWRMRPKSIAEVVGQKHILGKGKSLYNLIENDKIVSVIFYGPPGSGKTAVAHIIAKKTKALFIEINAVTSGIKEIRSAVDKAKYGKTIVFIDEIHRFNKTQQDALLPHIEKGEIILIGASTENPYFALTPALSSRTTVFQFNTLEDESLRQILKNALTTNNYQVVFSDDAIDYIIHISSGDARKALNTLELVILCYKESAVHLEIISKEHVMDITQDKALYYDESTHYDTISAFIKSVRGSHPDAALYWLACMIECGEDPLFIARRLIILASEDIGNADPYALTMAVATHQAIERIGMPEGKLVLAQTTVYLSQAPKSNSAVIAIESALSAVRDFPVQKVPLHLRDCHYKGAKNLGVGGYKYPHDYAGHYVEQDYMEEAMSFYKPTSEGFEKEIKKRLDGRLKKDV